jgi:hypothetical protein
MFELGVLANEAGDTASARTWWEQAAELGGPDAVEALGQSN